MSKLLVRPADPEIPADDPFKNDVLERHKIEPPLTEFVCQAQGPMVLAINGGWGTGKTTFLKMWRYKLEGRKCLCLSFNAWETDFAADPLVALVGELSLQIREQGEGSVELRKTLERLKKLGGDIAKRAIPTLIRIGTAGVLDGREFETEASQLMGTLAEDQVAAYEATKSEMAEFRKTLESLVQTAQKESGAPVVILVDELDRCRPSYAVELLERIKHLFNLPDVIFVLGLDRGELEHSIKALYGSDFNASGYLRRFIDFAYNLPLPRDGNFQEYLFRSLGIHATLKLRHAQEQDIQILSTMLRQLSVSTQLSLREQAQVVGRLRVTIQILPPAEPIYPLSLALIVFLYEWDISVFMEIMTKRTTPQKVLHLILNTSPLGDKLTSIDQHDSGWEWVASAFMLLDAGVKGIFSNSWQSSSKEHQSHFPAIIHGNQKIKKILDLAHRDPSLWDLEATMRRILLTEAFQPIHDRGTI